MKSITQPIQMTLPFEGKVCPRCDTWKPLADFGKHGKYKQTYCRNCCSVLGKAYYHANREECLIKQALYRQVNPEIVKQARIRCKERRRLVYNRRAVIYARLNPQKIKQARDASRAKYSQKYNERACQWRKNNRDKTRHNKLVRYAREKGAQGSYTLAEWEAMKRLYNYSCLRCHRSEPDIKLTRDHVLPIALGGSNTIDNIQPLCWSCNSSKKAKHIDYR